MSSLFLLYVSSLLNFLINRFALLHIGIILVLMGFLGGCNSATSAVRTKPMEALVYVTKPLSAIDQIRADRQQERAATAAVIASKMQRSH
jgi:hypothetical protein